MPDVLLLEPLAIKLVKFTQKFTANGMVIDELLLKKQRTPLLTVCPLLLNSRNYKLVYLCRGPTIFGAADARNRLYPVKENRAG